MHRSRHRAILCFLSTCRQRPLDCCPDSRALECLATAAARSHIFAHHEHGTPAAARLDPGCPRRTLPWPRHVGYWQQCRRKLDLGAGHHPRRCGSPDLHDPRFLVGPHRGGRDCVRVDVGGAPAWGDAGGGRRRRDVCRRQCARGLRRHACRARSQVTGRSRAAGRASRGRTRDGGRHHRNRRGRRCVAGARGRNHPRGWGHH